MSREKRIKNRLKSHLDHVSEETELDNSQVKKLVDECVSVDESFPIHDITASHFNSKSRKPSNIKVEFDIETGFEILAQSGYLSGEPSGIFAAVSALCALVSRKTKIDLEPETGFVYWIAYENQHDPWEIPKQELVELASEKSESMAVHFDLTEDEVEHRIRRLCNINSFDKEYRHEKVYLILKERCSSDWSS
jgi:hypothetical protein